MEGAERSINLLIVHMNSNMKQHINARISSSLGGLDVWVVSPLCPLVGYLAWASTSISLF